MGCDIHSVAIDANGNVIEGGKWADGKTANPDCEYTHGEGEPFGWRIYGVFAFLAGVRNYSGIAPISEPRGLPADLKPDARDDYWHDDCWLGDHSFSWLSVAELVEFDYDAMMEDRRVAGRLASGMISGACTAEPGHGKRMTWREFLGPDFFHDLAELQRIGADRVVFGFDS